MTTLSGHDPDRAVGAGVITATRKDRLVSLVPQAVPLRLVMPARPGFPGKQRPAPLPPADLS
ncbi:MAG: hypothetical protein VXY13_06000 [Pseudomonadota bacterium]|nr:hypothetical protein [Pseudomonadota bacterium]MEC8673278.1 hypothetical protein [Pseudomonadota bacterium]